MNLNNKQKILLIITLVFVFFLIYSPHLNYPYPYHIDEWRNLDEGIKLVNGEGYDNLAGLEIGFHSFVAILYTFFGSSLILLYKYLPAIWGVLAAIILFIFMYRLTNKFIISIFSIIFFASLKSNVNINGLWFFTPQTFCIPFIYLFFWLYYEGIKKENLKLFLISILTYILIFVSHPPSATFMIPIILIFSIINYKFFKKHYLISLSGLTVPLAAIIFIKSIFNEFSWGLIKNWIVFDRGFSPLEITLKFSMIYSFVGLILLPLGIWYAIKKRYYLFLIWTSFTFISIKFFEMNKFIYLAPYQRMFYYLGLSLPILSSFGLYYLIKYLKKLHKKLDLKMFNKIIITALLIIILMFTFVNYNKIQRNINLYKPISENDYNAYKFLSLFENKSKVMTTSMKGVGIYSISGHMPVASLY